MGGAVKKAASVATLGLSDAVLGATETPSTSTVTTDQVTNNEVSSDDARGLADDKRRRAKAAGLSSTILGGATGAPATTSAKTLLGQ
ncbi:hypothetical protein [Pseudomonas tussilaginis]|uniref:Uncharacterized protein n=1 Tax=Pseudomonas sp. Hg7Tf TaxID=3236988 RepID=A0AB39HVY7_9PSED|nr:hypothetical protein [Pseudomonas sp. Hg5Tf]MDH2559007.1 hypothetical protein [Pseudomonas sp. Hg5Tf]